MGRPDEEDVEGARVRAAVLGVLREARDAPDEPYPGELTLALTLHAWAHFIAGGRVPGPFAVALYNGGGDAWGRYEDARFDVFDVEAVPLERVEAAVEAQLEASDADGVLLAMPTLGMTDGSSAFAKRLGAELERLRAEQRARRPSARRARPNEDRRVARRMKQLEAEIARVAPRLLFVHVCAEAEQQLVLFTDDRVVAAGCQAPVRLDVDGTIRAEDVDERGAPFIAPLPRDFVDALGGFPWQRAAAPNPARTA